MAAAAAEPGAAVSTVDLEAPSEPGPAGVGYAQVPAGPDTLQDSEAANWREEDGVDGEARHVSPELEPASPTREAALERLCPGLPGDPEGGGKYRGTATDPQLYAVFLHSFPVPPSVTEAGLSLDEPAEPTTNVTTDRAEPADRDRTYTALIQTEPRPEPTEESTGGPEPAGGRGLPDPSPPCWSPKRRPAPEPPRADSPSATTLASVLDLSPGSEVRVSLDHVIDDALVVSFRQGEKVFSGVLMDVSRRFGPYGIPITVFPRRDDSNRAPVFLPPSPNNKDPPTKQEEAHNTPPPPPTSPHTLTSKPPPLFQEGAPYPPPLFIRDTYNQALPQPPPRKIKKPKRRYRCEEPTSIMNAIKLRPRQVLCEKCKGVVASVGHREVRRGAVELRSDDAARRKRTANGPISSEVKRLQSDDKRARPDRGSSSGIHTPSSSSSHRVLRGVASSSSSSVSSSRMRLKLNNNKVLAKGSVMECSKARQVLQKLARSSQPAPHRRPKDQGPDQSRSKAVTRAAALQNHNQKVHFTRRLQRLSGAGSSGHTALPPRMRLKPQRYRTDEGSAPCSSSLSHQNVRSSPPKLASNPALTQTATPPTLTAAPPTPPAPSGTQGVGGAADGKDVEPPPPSSSSLDSSHLEGIPTEPVDTTPLGDPSLSSPPTPTHDPFPSSFVPRDPAAPPPLPPKAEGEEEESGDPKRRHKPPAQPPPPSSFFSKSVSKCVLPDGRTVCVGDIVWAKIYGFPWWPARVLGITVSRRGDTGLAVRQEARVSWFGSPTTSFLPITQLSPFLETFQSRFDRKRKGPYRRAIAEAASAAKQLTPEVRALLTQFET
ncbi:PWWP domain-containing protein 2A [Oryzias melastigma]|uniref:PWWP domain-containing protein 2A n=1 Tax=Oryzias melastigma TaxID=30732 RepID=A0A834FSS3_ORYME|nr:PWWP domain-containing protein 2A [Oryzias melastigma]